MKRRISKRLLVGLLALTLMLTLMPLSAFAEDPDPDSTPITHVTVTNVPTPVPGESCSGEGIVISTEPAVRLTGSIYWYDETNDLQCDPDDTFHDGWEYSLIIDLKAAPGYYFECVDVVDDPDYTYAGVARMDGNVPARVLAKGDCLTLIGETTTAGTAGDAPTEPTPITSVKITNVPTPVAGGSCNTDAVVITSDPADKLNSASLYIGWYDNTANKYCAPTDAFIAGHEYTLYVSVKATTGYRFDSAGAGDVYTGTATINGEDASSAFTMASDKTDLIIFGPRIKIEEPATPTELTPITSVQVTNVPTPIAGRNCTTDGIKVTTNPANTVTVYKMEWISSSGAIMTSTDAFKEGQSYFLSVHLLPTEGNAFQYDSDGDYTGSVTVNGEVPRSAYRYSGGRMVINGPYMVGQKADAEVRYKTHIQMNGWETTWKKDGQMSGTSGEAKRLEGIRIDLGSTPTAGSIEYRTHIQNIGWETTWKKDGQMSGTSGEAKRLEAIQIRLTGDMAKKYDVYYRVHAQNFGWLDWAKNGESAGTAGYAYRLEGIQIQLVPKGYSAPGSTKTPYRHPMVSYTTHVQDYGWQANVLDGVTSGTVGKAKRLEAIKIQLKNQECAGNIEYKTHIQNIGWESAWKKNGEMSGTSGKAYRLEAIQIRLTGEMAKNYDIYYRVHAQNFGWMGWAKNGASAGTAGYAYRLEGIQIKVVPKGDPAPGSTANCFRQK